MEASVLHQPRVAFEAARTLVHISKATNEDLFSWYGDQLAIVLGAAYVGKFHATRDELRRSRRADIHSIEAGRWRVRLEDLLRTRAEVAESLRELTIQSRQRLLDTDRE